MEELKEVQEKVEKSKQELMVLARQNTEYNKEIVRLKAVKDDAEKEADKISSELKRISVILTDKQKELSILTEDIAKAKGTLSADIEARDEFFKNSEKEKTAIMDRMTFLRVQRTDLENEVASLSTHVFNAGVTINTQNFTISENERRINKSKSELSEIERRVGIASIEISSLNDKIKEKTAELQAKVDILTEQNNKLIDSVENKKKELTSVNLEIESKRKEFNDKVSEFDKLVSEREKSLKDAERKAVADAELNARTLSALNDREQELKLLELKIKELARKKDIDVQIASLSK